MRHAGVAGVAAIALAACAAAAANAESQGERIGALEQRMGAVEQKLENQGLLEMARQLDALEAELRRLRGEIEGLQHDLDAAHRQQRDQYVDLDTRLRAAETALAATQAATPAAGPDAEYQAAFNFLKEGRYDEATRGFTKFLADHHDHELASNAQYWLGEAYYVKRDYQAALSAFEGVLTGFPGARKSPDALLKAGYCHYELGHFDLARRALTRVTQEFPESTVAVEAADRLKRMTAEGR
ncbi:MAG: tol-pal system protein YbgF [Steroidobacteraceae bacterium]